MATHVINITIVWPWWSRAVFRVAHVLARFGVPVPADAIGRLMVSSLRFRP